jgi:hypothetical protein
MCFSAAVGFSHGFEAFFRRYGFAADWGLRFHIVATEVVFPGASRGRKSSTRAVRRI